VIKAGKADRVRDTVIALVLNATVWLTAFAGFFFCEGRSYRDSYLTTYGLYPAMFPWERGDVVYFGFNVGFGDVLAALLWPTIFGCYASFIVILGAHLLKRRRARSNVASPGRSSSSPSSTRQLTDWQTLAVAIFAILGAAIGAMILLAFMLDHAQTRGVSTARAEIRVEDGCGPAVTESDAFSAVHIVRELPTGTKSYDGFLITCASANCAIRDPVHRRSRVVPRDNISTFDTVPKERLYLPGIGGIND
jgi:hypothetical protein